MVDQIITSVFVVWVAISIFRGYRRGLWLTCFGIMGFVSAYIVCFFGGRPLISFLQNFGFNFFVGSLVVLPILFFGVQALVSSVLPLLVPSVRNKTTGNSLWGALLGGGIGILTGLVGVWFFDFLFDSRESLPLPNLSSAQSVSSVMVDERELGPVSLAAAELVGSGARAGAKLLGKNDQQSEVITLLARRPTETIKSAQTFFSSSELKELINDPVAQQHMASQDFEALTELPSFKNIMALSQSAGLLAVLGGEGDALPEELMAEKVSMVWRRMHFLKDDQTVKSILSDPEIMGMIEQQNIPALMSNPKIHKLVNVVLGDYPNMENDISPSSQKGPGAEVSVPSVDEGDAPDRPVYQWVDSEGVRQYTDDTVIPEDKRNTAIRLN